MAINLMLDNDNENIPIQVDDGNPYYVGARAYVERLSDGAKITVIDKEGTTTATVNDGADGQDGVDGSGIADISLTSTSGLVDTYTITFDNGTTETFDVTNGNGIASVEKTGTSGLIDTYTITFDNGDTETFTVTNGEKGDTGVGISSVEKTGTSGLVDTYTITFDDGDTETFTVTNGDKGDKGDTGNTGAAAGFGTVSATVDGNTGTPSVTVTTSGTDTAKNFAFAFSNLKGAKGDTGEVSEAELGAAVSDLEDEIESKIKSILPTDTASGAIAAFTDGTDVVSAKSLTVSLDPIQDLHGYDKPWSGGNGKNLLNIGSRVSQTTAGVVYTSDENYIIGNGTKNGGGYVDFTTLAMTLEAGTYYTKRFVISGTASNTVASYITDGTTNIASISASSENSFTLETQTTVYPRLAVGADGTVLTNYKIGIVISKTSGIDAYSPYSNICPISGHTEVNTQRTGVNLAEEFLPYALGAYNDGFVLLSNTAGSSFLFKCVKEQSYHFSSSGTTNRLIWAFYDEHPSAGTATTGSWTDKAYNGVATVTAPLTGWGLLYVKNSVDESLVGNLQIEFGSTATAYEPYQGTTYTTTLGRTVYGGTLDVVSGELVDSRYIFEPNNSTYISYASESGDVYNFSISLSGNSMPLWSDTPKLLSNRFSTDTPSGTAGRMVASRNLLYFAIAKSEVSSPNQAGARQWFADHPTQFCYELATPQTYQLTPQEVQLLLGTNNVWSDGDVEVTYYADIQRYIEKKLNA